MYIGIYNGGNISVLALIFCIPEDKLPGLFLRRRQEITFTTLCATCEVAY
jgi:hypothetical protein